MENQLRILTRDVKNPNTDRRKASNDVNSLAVFKAGTKFAYSPSAIDIDRCWASPARIEIAGYRWGSNVSKELEDEMVAASLEVEIGTLADAQLKASSSYGFSSCIVSQLVREGALSPQQAFDAYIRWTKRSDETSDENDIRD